MHENLIRGCIALIKQVTRAWFDPLRQTLQQWGFRSSVSDSLFYSKNNGYMLFILVYVDDILITGLLLFILLFMIFIMFLHLKILDQCIIF